MERPNRILGRSSETQINTPYGKMGMPNLPLGRKINRRGDKEALLQMQNKIREIKDLKEYTLILILIAMEGAKIDHTEHTNEFHEFKEAILARIKELDPDFGEGGG